LAAVCLSFTVSLAVSVVSLVAAIWAGHGLFDSRYEIMRLRLTLRKIFKTIGFYILFNILLFVIKNA
jgi:hypothetical protein